MDKVTGKELKEQMKKSPVRTRNTTVQEVQGFASDNRVGYVKEELAFLEKDGTARQAVIYAMSECDCGRILSQKNSLIGTCQRQRCTKFTCCECVRTCERCKKTYCPGHAIRLSSGKAYCYRCLPIKILVTSLKMFFNPGSERNKE